MKQRILTGIIGGILLLLVLFTSDITVIGAVVGAVSLLAVYELYTAVGLNKNLPIMIIGLVGAITIIFNSYSDNSYLYFILFALVFAYCLDMLFTNGKTNLKDIGIAIFGIVYIVLSMMHIVYARKLDFGKFNLFIIIIGACSTDIWAYFIGVFFGKHNLCEKISPKKTVEGSIGGFVGSVVFLILTAELISRFALDVKGVNYAEIIVLGMLCSVFAQLGDLSASVIKRQFGIKDYGHILPGHGGFMDRIDSIIFVAPMVYYFLSVFPVFK